MRIQEYLICAIQNIQVLVARRNTPKKYLAMEMAAQKKKVSSLVSAIACNLAILAGLCDMKTAHSTN
jgi:hypothetical protein